MLIHKDYYISTQGSTFFKADWNSIIMTPSGVAIFNACLHNKIISETIRI